MKQMIAQTLTKRLEQKSVDKITVKELVEACGISRQAFYYHFQDIMDVIEWITSQALDASVDASLAAPTPQQAIKTVILLFAGKRQADPASDGLPAQAGDRALTGPLGPPLFGKGPAGQSSRAGCHVQRSGYAAIRFHSYGLVGMLVETLPSAIDADALAGQLCRLLTGEIWGGARPD